MQYSAISKGKKAEKNNQKTQQTKHTHFVIVRKKERFVNYLTNSLLPR